MNGNRQKLFVPFVISILLLLFCPCIEAKAANASLPQLAKLGLLSEDNESAEAILLRAHQYDSKAIMASVVGYAHGIGAFTRSPYLASAWNEQLVHTGNFYETSLLSLMQLQQSDIDEDVLYGTRLVMCEEARKSGLAQLLQVERLFDVQQYCDGLEKKKAIVPEWPEEYAISQKSMQTARAKQKRMVEVVRAYRDKPCSPELQEELLEAYESAPLDMLAFYAATNHEPSLESTDTDMKYLLKFLNKANACPHSKEQSANQGENRLKITYIIYAITDFIDKNLFYDAKEIQSIIKSAHSLFIDSKDMAATRAMARYYRDGVFGFIENDRLALAWVQHAALGFDEQSQLLLALKAYAERDCPLAWAWATIMRKSGDLSAEVQELVMQLINNIESEAGADIIEQGQELEAHFFKETTAFGEWVKTQRARDGDRHKPDSQR